MAVEELWRGHRADDLRDEADNIRKYLRLVGRFLAEERERFEKEHEGEVGDDVSDERWRMRGILPTTLINTTLISIYSYGEIKIRSSCLFDASLRGIARGADAEQKLERELRNIEGVKAYWKGLDLAHANTPEWTEIMNMKDIRNHLIHIGEFAEDTERWKRIEEYEKHRYREGLTGLGIVWNQLSIGSEYCEEVIGLFHRFLTMQLEAMPSYVHLEKPK